METDSLIRQFYGLPNEESGPDLRGNFERFIAHLVRRRERAQPITVIIDGRETGVGKSSLAINIARRLDSRFSLENIIFSAAELYHLYETKPPGSAALYDESVLGLLSRRGARDEELSGLIGALSIVRKNGIATLLCVPKIHMLDSIVVNGLAPHYIFIEARGRGRVHRAHKGARYRKSQARIPYDLWEECSPLGWKNLDGTPFFEDYKRRAQERNRDYFREQQEIVAAKRERLLGGGRGRTATRGNVPERTMTNCVCAACGKCWRPRSPSGGRCPKCGSFERRGFDANGVPAG